MLHWRTAKVRIVVFAPPVVQESPEAAQERQRRQFLTGLGAEVFETAALPFHGILFGPIGSVGSGALTFPFERSDYEPAARFYSGRIDQAALVALHQLLPSPKERLVHAQFTPTLRRVA